MMDRSDFITSLAGMALAVYLSNKGGHLPHQPLLPARGVHAVR